MILRWKRFLSRPVVIIRKFFLLSYQFFVWVLIVRSQKHLVILAEARRFYLICCFEKLNHISLTMCLKKFLKLKWCFRVFFKKIFFRHNHITSLFDEILLEVLNLSLKWWHREFLNFNCNKCRTRWGW